MNNNYAFGISSVAFITKGHICVYAKHAIYVTLMQGGEDDK